MRSIAPLLACLALVIPAARLSAQTSQDENFPDLGFAVRVPPGWVVTARPSPDKQMLKISRQVTPDLIDECLVSVSDRTPDGQTQEQLDAQVRDRFYSSPLPAVQAIEGLKRGLEQRLSVNGRQVKVENCNIDSLGGHPSTMYTYSSEQAGSPTKQFVYFNTFSTPQRNYTAGCQASSSNMDDSRMEFGVKIHRNGMYSFLASFALR